MKDFRKLTGIAEQPLLSPLYQLKNNNKNVAGCASLSPNKVLWSYPFRTYLPQEHIYADSPKAVKELKDINVSVPDDLHSQMANRTLQVPGHSIRRW